MLHWRVALGLPDSGFEDSAPCALGLLWLIINTVNALPLMVPFNLHSRLLKSLCCPYSQSLNRSVWQGWLRRLHLRTSSREGVEVTHNGLQLPKMSSPWGSLSHDQGDRALYSLEAENLSPGISPQL